MKAFIAEYGFPENMINLRTDVNKWAVTFYGVDGGTDLYIASIYNHSSFLLVWNCYLHYKDLWRVFECKLLVLPEIPRVEVTDESLLGAVEMFGAAQQIIDRRDKQVEQNPGPTRITFGAKQAEMALPNFILN
jgi:hypothetical protein